MCWWILAFHLAMLQLDESVRQGRQTKVDAGILNLTLSLLSLKSRAPELLLSRIHATMPHPVPHGREPSGGNGHYPKPDPGLLDYYYHGSIRPCPPCPRHVPRGHGVRGAVRPWGQPPMPSRAKTGNVRGVPISEAFRAVLRWASPLETTDVTPSRIQGSRIAIITNLN